MDGEIVAGAASMGESVITGESMPRDVKARGGGAPPSDHIVSDTLG